MKTEIKALTPAGQYQPLDLYEDEPIPLVFNADDYTNIAERSSTYSKSFQVPGTKGNNSFFNYVFDVKVDSTFDPHKKTKCIINQNTIEIFEGWLQLNEILITDNDKAYEITLYSDEVNIKDTLSELYMRDLDLTELVHTYSITAVRDSWDPAVGVVFANPANAYALRGTQTVKYPFVRYNSNVGWNSQSGGYVDIPQLGGGGTGDWTSVFRPFVNVDYLFRTILLGLGYTIDSTFFTTDAWKKLYCDFNTGASNFNDGDWIVGSELNSPPMPNTYGTTWTKINWDTSSPMNTTPLTTLDPADYYDTATDVMTLPAGSDNTYVSVTTRFYIRNASLSNITVHCRIAHNDISAGTTNYYPIFSQVVTPSGALWFPGFNASSTAILADTGDEFWVEIETASGSVELVNENFTNSSWGSQVAWTIIDNRVSFSNVLAGHKGDMSQWDFIKNFITMFNLVMTTKANNPTILEMEPYDTWIDSGKLHDWDHKLDIEEQRLVPIEGLSKDVRFMHEEDTDDWITENHSYPNEWKYSKLFESGDEIYDEALEEISVDGFAATYCKFHWGTLFAPQIYNKNGDNAWNNLWRVLYDNGVQTASVSYGVFGPVYNDYLLFSMCDTYPVSANNSLSLNFNVVNYVGIGGGVIHSLFNVYWFRYIDELYHKDTRVMTVNMMLSAADIQDFHFNDVVMMMQKKWRVKQIDYDGEGKAKVELITIKDL